jgi:DnaJ-class molecular chaperone
MADKKCASCKGTGKMASGMKCKACGGKGMIPDRMPPKGK